MIVPTKAQHSRYYAVLRKRLRAWRDDAELTQRELGELLGKPQSWVHNCETGNRRMDILEFAQWVDACGVKPAAALDMLRKETRMWK